jgi:hypothetical protein
MYYSSKELAVMMDMSYSTFRAELRRNSALNRQKQLRIKNYELGIERGRLLRQAVQKKHSTKTLP